MSAHRALKPPSSTPLSPLNDCAQRVNEPTAGLFTQTLQLITELHVWAIGLRDNPKCLDALASFPRLRVVGLTGLPELPALLAQLEELSLRGLQPGCDVSSSKLSTLAWCSALTNLRSFHAGGNLFESLESLPACPQLTELNLLSSDHLISLNGLQSCSQLTKLSLPFCSSISSLEPLKSCPKLRLLSLQGCKADLPGLEHLRGLPNLKITGL
jgi:hypothetical protein